MVSAVSVARGNRISNVWFSDVFAPRASLAERTWTSRAMRRVAAGETGAVGEAEVVGTADEADEADEVEAVKAVEAVGDAGGVNPQIAA